VTAFCDEHIKYEELSPSQIVRSEIASVDCRGTHVWQNFIQLRRFGWDKTRAVCHDLELRRARAETFRATLHFFVPLLFRLRENQSS
jgi:hypothetical protein